MTEIFGVKLAGHLLTFMLFLISFAVARAGETIDSIRDEVNQSWYELAAGKCKESNVQSTPFQKSSFRCYLQQNGYSEVPGFEKAAEMKDLSQNLQEKLFFDAVASEQARRNTCQFNLWTSLSQTKPSKDSMQKSDQLLGQQHPGLGKDLNLTPDAKNTAAATATSAAAKAAQTDVVKQMIDTAQQIVANEKEIKKLSLDRSDAARTETQRLAQQNVLLNDSIPYAEDSDARSFFQGQIYGVLSYNSFYGKSTDTTALLDNLTGTGPSSFQQLVVNKKLQQVSQEQSELASMQGKYTDQHSYKVASFASGDAERMLYTAGSNVPDFSSLSCNMQAKYGIGSDIANLGGHAALTVASAFVGPAAGLVLKLAEAGVVTARTGLMLTNAMSYAQRTAAAVDLGASVLHDCIDVKAGRGEFSACEAAQEVKQTSPKAFVNKDISKTACVLNSVLGALNLRGVKLNSERLVARATEERAVELGIADEYKGAVSTIAKSNLSSSTKSEIQAELATALKSAARNGGPSPELIDGLAQEDPEALLNTLRGINAESQNLTWAQKVKAWLKKQTGLTADEKSELEACLANEKNGVACRVVPENGGAG